MTMKQIEGLLETLASPPPCIVGNGRAPGPDTRPAYLAMRDGLKHCLGGQIALAAETLQHAYILYRRAGDKRSASLAQRAIELCFDAISDCDAARAAYGKSIRMLQEAAMHDEAARVQMRMARFEAGHGEKREAMNALRAALVVYREIVHPVGQVEALCQYAELALQGGARDEAREHAREALELVEQIDDVNTHEKLRVRAETLLVA